MRRPPPKSRERAERVRIVLHMPNVGQPDGYAEQPGYSGHNGGSFSDAGYRPGLGMLGFRTTL